MSYKGHKSVNRYDGSSQDSGYFGDTILIIDKGKCVCLIMPRLARVLDACSH